MRQHTDTDATGADVPLRLADALRERSQALHTRAERTGVISDVLRKRAVRSDYVLFVRNLVPIYQHIEAGLERHRDHPLLAALARPEVYRTHALTLDLLDLHGPDWAQQLPILPATAAYVARIAAVTDDAPVLLIAHAYVRYLGDLNGGQILGRLLAQSLDLPASALSFYAFPNIADLRDFRASYRAVFDGAGDAIADHSALLDEVVIAFEMNIEVSESIGASAVAA